MHTKQFIETWEIHNRINLYLRNAIKKEHLADIYTTKGRNVGELSGPIHNVKLMWLHADKPDLLKGQTKIEKEKTITKKALAGELNKSAKAIALLLETGFEHGKIKGFKPHPAAFLVYLISHESHHIGQIILCLKQSGHPVDKKIMLALWEWGLK